MQSAFDKAAESVPTPPRKVVIINDTHWASKFEDRPVNPIQVGLRLLSIEDQEVIRQLAMKAATDAISNELDSQIAAQNMLLVTTVARSICSPRDTRKPHDFFSCPDDLIPIAFTEQTVKWLFDEIEKLTVEMSPIFSESTDEEIVDTCDMLLNGALDELADRDPVKASRVRRYLDFVRTELGGD